MKDEELILKIKDDADQDSLLELIDRHSGIYHTMVDRFLSGPINCSDKQNFLEDKSLAIYNSAINFDPDRNTKFPTYLANDTKWKCLNTLNKRKKFTQCSLSEVKSEPSSDNGMISMQEQEVLSLFKSFVKQECDEKTKKVIDMRYNQCLNKTTPWRIIAGKIGMSIQGTINIHNRCLSQFKKVSNYV